MNRKIAFILALLMVISFSLTACQSGDLDEETEGAQTKTIVDSRGKSVEIEYPADNVVCLLNSGLNDLYMLGAAEVVTGIDQWTYDNEITYNLLKQVDERIANKTLPAVDNNVEKIISMKPDAVVIWAGNEEQIKALEDQGVKVIGIQVNNFDEVYTKMEIMGQIVGKEDRAQEIIDYTKAQLADIDDKTDTLTEDQKKSGIFVWGASKLDLAGSTSTGNSLLELCGVSNKAGEIDEEHFVAKMKDVISWNPDTIVMWNVADLDPRDYFDDSQWADITAVQDKSVYEIPDELTFYCDLWTVKYAYALKYMAKNIYPDLFKDMDLETEKSDMVKTLYNVDFE